MSYAHLEVETDRQVGWVWLNRPGKLNALSADMWADLPAAVSELAERVRVLVIAGRGRAFTVGIDLGLLAGLGGEAESHAARSQAFYREVRRLQQSFTALERCPVPVIAAIHGYCLGAGIDLITACDIRLAAADATFSVRETRMGLVADVGTLQRLPRVVGPGHAAELAFTGNDIDAVEAERIGLVNRVHPSPSELWEAAAALAEAIAANSPLVVQGVKAVMAASRDRRVDEGLDYVALWNAAFAQSNDLREAVAAFLEQRPPDFTGT